MTFHLSRLRVKELAQALDVDYSEIIASCTLLNIPASSPLTSLTIDQCKKIISHFEK